MEEMFNGLRFIMAISECATPVIYKIFLWGTPDKSMDQNLDDYLKNLKPPSFSNYLYIKNKNISKLFDNTQMKLIQSNSDGSEFDIPLLYKCIKVASEKVALKDDIWYTKSSEMEYHITAVKNMRNDASHGRLPITNDTLKDNKDKLEELLTNCLKTSGERYQRDEAEVDELVKNMTDNLRCIMEKELFENDLMSNCSEQVKDLFIEDCRANLKMSYENIVYINPVSFITNNLHLEVDKIFVDINVKQGKTRGAGKHVDYRDILQLVQSRDEQLSRPQILLLEGLAGSGKTTLVKLITKEWTVGSRGAIKGLDHYDLLLLVQCRDSRITSYKELLERLMHKISLKFGDLVPRLLKLCKLLIIIDGLDEMSDNSRDLVKDLLDEFRNTSHTTFLCTSRSEKVEMFQLMIPEEYDLTIAELHGIPERFRPKFVYLNHKAISSQTGSNRDTGKLVKKVQKMRGLQDHLALPMNLIYLIYIWDQEPDELNIMTVTQTELYHKIHHMCQKKLLGRFAKHSETEKRGNKFLERAMNNILIKIYRKVLESLSRDHLILKNEAVDQLMSDCDSESLPYEEVLSAFFNLEHHSPWDGHQEWYSTPHKGIQDYFSALHIVITVKSSSPPGSIREVLTQTIAPVKVDMAKYQNVLVHVAGLLHLTMDQVPEALSREVVDLLSESGMKDEDQWLDLLENAKMNPDTVKAITHFINSNNIYIRDNRVRSYTALLPQLSRANVLINISGDTDDLHHLLPGLVNNSCVELRLYNHYSSDEGTATTSDNILQGEQYWSHLVVFMGRLSGAGMTLLPTSLKHLHLAVVSDDHARCLLPQLHDAVSSRLPQLVILGVRVAVGVSPGALMQLPRTDEVQLDLSDVSDDGVARACQVAKALQPLDGYRSIQFPRTTLTMAGYHDMVRGLADHGVQVGWALMVPSSVTLTDRQWDQMKCLARNKLHCFFSSYKLEEVYMFRTPEDES